MTAPDAHAATEALYAAFARYPKPRVLEGCPCCTSPGAGRDLLAVPLRGLPAAALAHYSRKALTTWGGPADYKYFLPRIYEVTLAGDADAWPHGTFGKLAYGGFPDWPAQERAALADWWRAAWPVAVGRRDHELAGGLLRHGPLVLGEQEVAAWRRALGGFDADFRESVMIYARD